MPFTTGIRVDGCKEILGLWIQESKHAWMQIFDELKSRGVQEVGFISMDRVSELEEGAKAIFPEVVVQRCIVHLIGNSLKYVPMRERLHRSLEKNLWCREHKSLPRRIRALLPSLGKISRRECRLETLFCLRRATF